MPWQKLLNIIVSINFIICITKQTSLGIIVIFLCTFLTEYWSWRNVLFSENSKLAFLPITVFCYLFSFKPFFDYCTKPTPLIKLSREKRFRISTATTCCTHDTRVSVFRPSFFYTKIRIRKKCLLKNLRRNRTVDSALVFRCLHFFLNKHRVDNIMLIL